MSVSKAEASFVKRRSPKWEGFPRDELTVPGDLLDHDRNWTEMEELC